MRRLLIALLLALIPTTAHALEIRTGGIVAIRESEHVPDDLLAIAATVSILGRVDGDVYALGQLVTVHGRVAGDVIAAGQELRLGGIVGGDVRALGDAVQLVGAVERNVLAVARQLRLQSGSGVGGSWTGWAEAAFLSGSIGRTLWLTSGSARLDGPIGGPARVMADTLVVGPAARVPTSLEYWSAAEATVDARAQVPNATRHEPRPSRELARVRELAAGAGRLLTVGLLVSSLVAALVFGMLAPRVPEAALAVGPGRSLTVGLGVLLVPLPVALVLGLTVIGLPLAVGLIGLWGLGLAVGWLLAGAALAALVDRHGRLPTPLVAVGGVSVLWLIGQLPVAGTVATVGAAVVGAGALLRVVRRARLAP